MRHPYSGRTIYWSCRNCGCQNELAEPRCWNCNADTDGELPDDEAEEAA